jgi:magnesium-transporting ATPase (P-type)
VQVTEFFKKAKAHEIARDAHCGEDDFVCQMQAYWTAPFMPNLLNTVVFLVETSQMISVFFANYKGRPWMKGMLENHPLFLSVFACIGGVVVAAWEFVPQLNEIIQLAPFPDDAFRSVYAFVLMCGILAQYLWLAGGVRLFKSVAAVSADDGRCPTVLTYRRFRFNRYKVVILVASTILGTFLWDRLCVFLFAPKVFKASMGE